MQKNNKKFESDLEFVQMLSNPDYLLFVYKKHESDAESFLQYLKYLRYFNSEPYLYCLIYPQCLLFLEFIINILEDKKYLSKEEIKLKLEKIKEAQLNKWRGMK